MLEKSCRNNIKNTFIFNKFSENRAIYEIIRGKTQNVLLRVHGNSGYTIASQCYVIRTLYVLFYSPFLFQSGTPPKFPIYMPSQ
jgi:hypothetical protein